jgi:thiamine biosynthesis lipoprotein
MPVSVEIVGATSAMLHERVFALLEEIDRRFSPWREDSEVSAMDRDPAIRPSRAMQEVLSLAEEVRVASDGYFDVRTPDGRFDPSGIVKGWAIAHAAKLLRDAGEENFVIDAGGDIQTAGRNAEGRPWQVGVRSPFDTDDVIKIVALSGEAVATSGDYIRGRHIYDPREGRPAAGLVSLTVIAADIVLADCFATAAFAMGSRAIDFIASIAGLEGYAVTPDRRATMTAGFRDYIAA